MLGLTNVLKKLFGDKSTRDIKELSPVVEDTAAFYEDLKALSNDELRGRTLELKKRIADYIAEDEEAAKNLKKEAEELGDKFEEKEALYAQADELIKQIDAKLEEVLEEIMPEAFAVVKETARRFTENEALEVTATEMDRDLAASRESIQINGDKASWSSTWLAAGAPIKWNMVHYDVQLIGGSALHMGKIAEMQTGEGKTLVATLPVFLNALTGKGVHLITVNDYLAKRDAEWMGPIFEFHGLTVDCIDKHQPNSESRRNAYLADITYGTNNEFGFDYLRDNMTNDISKLVQRKHHFAIVDEVDSVLIDDARTPLIISGPTPGGDRHEFNELKPKIEKIVAAQRKLVTGMLADAKRMLKGIEEGNVSKDDLQDGGMALLRSYRGLPKTKPLIKFLSEPGVRQHLQKTENHYMQDQEKEMHKVDKELYFTINEKQNSIELTEKGIDLLADSTEDRDFFVMPDFGGMIAEIDNDKSLDDDKRLAAKEKLTMDFSVKSERIHTMNQLLKAYALFQKEVEYVVMDGKVKIVDEQTGRIMDGRRYSDGLHQAIEAKENVKIEAATQTYATITLQNFFRMYHKLAGMTGTAETEAKEFWDIYELDVVVVPTNRPIARDDQQDKVYKTVREKYNAVIDEIEILTKAGRPVLVGTTSVEVSELLSRMLKLKGIKHNVLNAKLHQRESEIVANAGHAGAVTIATNMAGRGTDIKLGDGVKESGGLAILGTERHESRRIDRQLRGRAGRQGDPGSSVFYVSLEDNLMRLFGSERIAKMMDRLGLEEGEVIQHSMITKSIERAQKKVEENNFGVRKHLLEYDDVMNQQRTVIYKKRKHALFGDRLDVDIANMFYDVCASIVGYSKEMGDYEEFKFQFLKHLAVDFDVSEEDFKKISDEELIEKAADLVMSNYTKKCESIAAQAYPVIKNVYENQGNTFENMAVPFTDGRRTMQIAANIEKCYNSEGRLLVKELEKNVVLALIDNAWKEHLRSMDDLRQSVQQARYEQKDPLLIYKLESFDLFKKMLDGINKDTASFLIRAALPISDDSVRTTKAPAPKQDDLSRAQTNKTPAPDYTSTNTGGGNRGGGGPSSVAAPPKPKVQPVRVEKKVGRNDPCPCGSGKKYKQCHGRS